jgi:hypothetical protein
MQSVSLLFGLLPAALQAALSVILVWRKLYRRFPLFLTYTLYSISTTFIRLWTMADPTVFFISYWSTEIVYGILALLAIREVFASVLEMYYSLYAWTRWLLPGALIFVVGDAVWQAAYRPLGGGPLGSLATGAYSLVMGILCLEAAVFLLCLKLGFRRHSPIRWTRYEAGILIGFGLAALATALIRLARPHVGPAMELAFRYLPPMAYMAATLIWLGAFWRAEPPLVRKPTDPELFKRAAAFMREAVEDSEKDPELRSYPSPNLLPRAN